MFKYNLDQSCIYYFSTKHYAIRIFVTRFSAVSLHYLPPALNMLSSQYLEGMLSTEHWCCYPTEFFSVYFLLNLGVLVTLAGFKIWAPHVAQCTTQTSAFFVLESRDSVFWISDSQMGDTKNLDI